ncbi:hypothetical protein HDE_13344 [Halotydeus destructor]|nr:hypothetical protein HDE_13344 [Halotydeus destructor]
MNPNITWLVFEMTCGIIAGPVGFAGFIYCFIFHLYPSAVFILLTTILIAGGLHLNLLLFRQKLDEWYDPYALENLKMLGLIIFSAAFIGSGYYLASGITRHEKLELHSYYTSAISSLITLFSASYFFVQCRRYKRYVELCAPPLLQNDRTWRRF